MVGERSVVPDGEGPVIVKWLDGVVKASGLGAGISADRQDRCGWRGK